MTVRRLHKDFDQVVAADAQLERIATDFVFTEGPVWHPTGQTLLFSDIASSCQYIWSEAAGLAVFRKPSNQANGNTYDRDGLLVSCEHASSSVVRIEHDQKLVKLLASHYDGKALNSPNDIVCDRQNRLWFTDPTFGRIREDLGILRDTELDFRGVFRLDPDGSLTLAAAGFQQPNGLCFSLDEQHLFINDTRASNIQRYTVKADGSLSEPMVWATVSGEGEGAPDGMKLSLQSHVLCNGPGGVHVFDADATLLGIIEIPEKSTNFTFGGPDHRQLFITASTSVYRIALNVAGPPVF